MVQVAFGSCKGGEAAQVAAIEDDALAGPLLRAPTVELSLEPPPAQTQQQRGKAADDDASTGDASSQGKGDGGQSRAGGAGSRGGGEGGACSRHGGGDAPDDQA
eukprot:scaffold1.g5860.t1